MGTSIALVGIDGAGKSDQVSWLIRSPDIKFPVKSYRSPGGTDIGLYLREHLLYRNTTPAVKRFMFLLDHALLQEQIESDSATAILDRSLVCNVVYELGFTPKEYVDILLRMGLKFPHTIIFLGIDPQIAIQRCSNRENGVKEELMMLENAKLQNPQVTSLSDYFELLNSRYLETLKILSEKGLSEVHFIDAHGEREVIHDKIKSIVAK